MRQEIFAIFNHWQEFFANLAEVCENFLDTKIYCPTVNMKYNARVFLPESAKGMSEVTQNSQFILRGLRGNTATLNLYASLVWGSYLSHLEFGNH